MSDLTPLSENEPSAISNLTDKEIGISGSEFIDYLDVLYNNQINSEGSDGHEDPPVTIMRCSNGTIELVKTSLNALLKSNNEHKNSILKTNRLKYLN